MGLTCNLGLSGYPTALPSSSRTPAGHGCVRVANAGLEALGNVESATFPDLPRGAILSTWLLSPGCRLRSQSLALLRTACADICY